MSDSVFPDIQSPDAQFADVKSASSERRREHDYYISQINSLIEAGRDDLVGDLVHEATLRQQSASRRRAA